MLSRRQYFFLLAALVLMFEGAELLTGHRISDSWDMDFRVVWGLLQWLTVPALAWAGKLIGPKDFASKATEQIFILATGLLAVAYLVSYVEAEIASALSALVIAAIVSAFLAELLRACNALPDSQRIHILVRRIVVRPFAVSR